MRLVRTDILQGFILDEFDLERAPPYAILSHRWGDNEVLLRDLTSDGPKDEPRFSKIIGCCKRAREDGYSHVWIDTCCIDQKSSAELSESINSMFMWYTKAAICYVHMRDVLSRQDPDFEDSAFRASEWFTRGWTLQELIAPSSMVFYTKDWEEIGTKGTLARTIEEITKIGYSVLCKCIDLATISVAEKMSWASNRETTKVEDRAYSLLGIFGVNMTTIYGEGQKAFQRLQYEIISQSNDWSIFAWDVYSRDPDDGRLLQDSKKTCGLLAPSPDSFADSAGIIAPPFMQFANQWGYQEIVADIQRTNTGIRLKVPIFEPSSPQFTRRHACVMAIGCKKRERFSSKRYYTVGLVLQSDNDGYYTRLANVDLQNADRLNWGAQRTIETIDVRNENRHDSIDDIPSSMFTHVPKNYEVVLKAHTLNTLRNGSGWVPNRSHKFGEVGCSNGAERAPGKHAYSWVEDPQTKETDFVMKVQCGPETEYGPRDSKHDLRYFWEWDDIEITLMITMVNGTFVGCEGILLSSEVDFYISSIDSDAAPKANYFWSGNVPNKGKVDVLLTLTDATAEMVRYELDLMIHASQPRASSSARIQGPTVYLLGKRKRKSEGKNSDAKGYSETDPVEGHVSLSATISRLIEKRSGITNPSVPTDMNFGVSDTETEDDTDVLRLKPNEITRNSGPEQSHEEPVRWVPACLGIIPKDAYIFPASIGKISVVRASHEGIIRFGTLGQFRPWALLIPSFNDFHVARICDYEVLVGTSSLEWVEVTGPFTLEALGAALPIVISEVDADGRNLYVVRVQKRQTFEYGTVRVGSRARAVNSFNERIVNMSDEYQVLVYTS